MVAIDKEKLRAKYRLERDKRLREDGNEQYIRLADEFAVYLEDPHTPVKPRAPVRDHVAFACVGGGFAGLLVGARLKQAGIEDVRIVEKGGDFGGAWYWNRYPGAQCDTASMVYMPLLEETGWMPTEKYAHGPEILQHCRRIGEQFGLYERALFHTEVTDLEWDDAKARWIVRSNRGDAFTAQFISLGTGPLHVPKLPGIPGIRGFKGKSFHTSRWDYDYTGGDANGAPLDKLADKRVALIGTGATAVQAAPPLARACQALYVFQRTPSSVDVRANEPIDPQWFATINAPGWQRRWLENFTANQSQGAGEEDLVKDGWTDLSKRIRAKIFNLPPDQFTQEGMMAAWEDADNEKMEEIRARVDAIVADKATAASLKAWYRQLCKRPCFHDEYLQAFNEPAAHLIDTDGKGVERITETGVVVAGKQYPVDCIIYGTGFEVGTEYKRRAGFDIKGRDGLALSSYWAEGMRTMHGVHARGFPNAFFVQPTQGANLISNVPHNLSDAALTIAAIVKHARDAGAGQVEVSRQAEEDWLALLLTAPPRIIGSQECTPGYYNNEGKDPGPIARSFFVGYPAGPMAYFQYIDGWRRAGDFKGLEFR
jgi:cyclohexanone monooxygenase